MAENGSIGMSIGYTLFRRTDPTSLAPRDISDVQLAVRYARTQWPGLPVCVFGFSAGGHLALMAGALPRTLALDARLDPLGQAALYPGVSSQPDCVIDLSGPTDIPGFIATTSLAAAAATIMPMIVGLGSTPAVRLAWWSPPSWVTPGMVPTVVIHGHADAVVVPAQADMLVSRLNSFGVPNLYIIHNGGHMFGGLTVAQRKKIVRQAYNWVLAHP